jgi:NTE family protein
MISASILNEQQRKLCDILIDHVPHLKYETSDFYNASDIVENGRIALSEKMSALVELKQQIGEGNTRNDLGESKNSYSVSEVEILDTSREKRKLLQGRTLLDSSDVTIEALERIVRISYGSRLYDKLNYMLEPNDDAYKLRIRTEERTNTNVKAAIHFDTERGAGIVLNLTTRDLIGTNSRALATVDLAQNPKIRLQYQKYFQDPKWWYRLEGFRERVSQATYVNGERSGDFQFDYAEAFAQLNRDISNYTTFSAAFIYNRDSYRPGISPQAKNISPDTVSDEINSYRFQNIGGRAAVYQNTLNRRYFHTEGRELRLVANYYPLGIGRIDWYSNRRQDIREDLHHIFQFELSWMENYALGKKLVIRPEVHAGSFFTNERTFYDVGTIRFFVLGGIDPRANKQYINFAGLREGELPVSQMISTSLSAQWEFINNLYLIPSINAASVGTGTPRQYFEGFGEFNTNWQDSPMNAWVYSLDLNLSVDTPIGPLQLQASKVNRVDDLRFYFSFGYFLF